jgi:hypothetical protein
MVTEAGYLDIPTPKDLAGYLNYPADIRDTAKSGMGRIGNRRLHYFAEFISVNVGGSYRNGKESSPLRCGMSVGGLIVVGGWESQPQGEGDQGVNAPRVESNSESDVGRACRKVTLGNRRRVTNPRVILEAEG